MFDIKIEQVEKLTSTSSSFPYLSFLQTADWAKIQEAYGNNCLFFVFKKADSVVGFALAIERVVFKFFKYLYFPSGPFFEEGLNQEIKSAIISSLSKKVNVDFLRIEPSFFDFGDEKMFCKTRDIQPAKTTYLNLKNSLEDLYKNMKSKTRYNIRLASRKGVEVSENRDPKTASYNFIKLMRATSKRDSFSAHEDNYYRNIIDYDNGFIRVFEAHYQGQVLASGIFSFSGDCVTYLHGASDNEYRNVMAPYLLHDTVIKEAKEKGFSFYDFYGVDNLKWPGVSRFKYGFGGEEFSYPGTYDFKVNNFKYFVYSFLRKLNSLKNRFL